MTETTNLGLKKPGAADTVAIADLNANADKLDAIIGLLSSLSTTEKSSLVAAMNELWSISPTVTTESTVTSGLIPAVKVTITDKDGDHEFTIKDGKAGKNGTAGTHGDSVTVTVLPLSATEEHTNGGQQLTFKKTTYASGGGSSVSTEAVELWHGNNGISGSFLDVTFTVSDSTAVSDKTVEEVYNAYLAGYQVRGKSSGEIFQLAWCEKLGTDSYQIEFASLGGIGSNVAVDRISVVDAAGSTTSWTSARIYA